MQEPGSLPFFKEEKLFFFFLLGSHDENVCGSPVTES